MVGPKILVLNGQTNRHVRLEDITLVSTKTAIRWVVARSSETSVNMQGTTMQKTAIFIQSH